MSRTALRSVLAALLAFFVILPFGALQARADPLPATYSGSTHGDILGLQLASPTLGLNVNASLAHSATTVDSTASPRAEAEGSNLHVGALGIPISVVSAGAESGPAAETDSFDQGLGEIDVLPVLDTGLVTTDGSTTWAGDLQCVPDGDAIAASNTSLASANLGVTLLGLGVNILNLQTVETSGTTTLQDGSVVSTSSGNLAGATLVNDLVQIEVVNQPTITATSDGTTGTVSANDYSVNVTVGGATTLLTAGGTLGIPLDLGLLSVDLQVTVGALDDTSVGATGSGSMNFINVEGTVSGPLGQLLSLDLGLLPLNAVATGAEGGVECDAIDPPVIATPADGSTTGDQTPTITGTGLPGATVTVTEGDLTLGTATVDPDGNWSLTPEDPLSIGLHTISAIQAIDGSTSNPSNPVSFTVADQTPPDPPVIQTPTDGSSTNDTTPTIGGTAEPGSVVTVIIDGEEVGTAPVDSEGNWSFEPTEELAEGPHEITATATDDAGNTSDPSDPVTVTVDTEAPGAPTITNPEDGSVISDTTPTITGTGEAGATVTVLLDGVQIGTAPVDDDGNWELPVESELPDGSHVITATQADEAGNVSDPVTSQFAIDTAAPAAPILVTPANGSIITDPTPTVSGTAEPGSTVVVTTADGTELGEAVVDGAGNWSFDSIELADGQYAISAIAIDAAGNESPQSNTNTFTIDSTAPAAPVITAPEDGETINDPTPTITGTGEAGATVEVSIDGVLVGTTVVNGDGDWSLAVPTPLPEGDHTVIALQTDAAGNGSDESAPVGFTVDLTDPDAPVIESPADGDVVGVSTPTISGTAEAGATVVVTDQDGNELGQAVADGDGNWSFDSAELEDGVYTITAVATDEAGNDSPASEPVTFVVDTTAPDAPAITGPVDGSTITDTTPTVTGTGEPGATVTVVIDGDEVGEAVVDGNGAWFLELDDPLAEGDHTVVATQTDPAGNTSGESDPVTFTVDTTADPAPVITEPTNGSTTNDSTPTISGTGVAGSTVTVTTSDGVELGSAEVDGAGNWSFDSTELEDGTYTITAVQVDGAGNESAASEVVIFTVDTAAPDAPVITAPEDGSSTADPTPTIAGTGEAGATVTVVIDGTEVGTAVVDGSGIWTLPLTDPLGDGDHTVVATQTDPSGNESDPSDEVSFTVDTTAPDVPVITSPSDGEVLTDPTPEITGTAEPGATVEVIIDGEVVGTTEADDEGNWTFTPSEPLTDAEHTVEAVAIDPVGNRSDPSEPVTFAIDATAPAPPEITEPTDGTITNDPQPVISGTAEANSTVTVTIEGGAELGTAVADGDGNWELTPTEPLADGDYTIVATATDEAGNTGEASEPVSFMVDTTAPGAPAITAPTDGTVTNTDPVTIIGTGEAGMIIEVTIDGEVAGTTQVNDDGDWSFTPAEPLGDGDHLVSATQIDPAGNESVPSNEVSFTIDTEAPEPPAVTEPTAGSTVADQTPTITGTGEIGATVEVFVDGESIGTTTVDPDGTWTIDVPDDRALSDGGHTVFANQVDPAGNLSGVSESVEFFVDATAAPPAIEVPTDGTSTNDSTPTISGVGEPGATVTVTTASGMALGTAVVDDDGNWSLDSIELEDGTYTITASQVDAVGNTSEPSAEVTFTVDTAAPAAPVITSPTDGESLDDNTPTVTGTGEPGATVTVIVDGEEVGTAVVGEDGNWSLELPEALEDGEHTVIANQTDPAGNTSPDSAPIRFVVDTEAPDAPAITAPTDGSVLSDSTPTISGTGEAGATITVYDQDGDILGTAVVDADGNWTLESVELISGEYTIVAEQSDAAGNVSEQSEPVSFVLDAVAPGAPVITEPGDGDTINDDTPTVTGTGEPGATVTVTVDGEEIGTAVVDEDGNWSVEVPEPLEDGDHVIGAVQTDPAGNVSEEVTVDIVVDTTVEPPTITAPTDGSSITDDTPEIIGTGEPGATVIISVDGDEVGQVIVDEDGNWSFTPEEPLGEGDHVISAIQVDPAGNTSEPTEVEVTVIEDAEAPPPPTITSPEDGEQVDDRTPTIEGTGRPGAVVTVIIDGTDTISGTVDHNGNWSITVPDALGCGRHTIVAVQAEVDTLALADVDATSLTSEPSDPVTFDVVCSDSGGDGDGNGDGTGDGTGDGSGEGDGNGNLPGTGAPAGMLAIALIGAMALAGGLLVLRRRFG